MSTQQSAPTATSLPTGRWEVDQQASRLQFRVKTMWGLATVTGTFRDYSGSLLVEENGEATGELVIDAASLDTENAKRDHHLRSPNFFHVEVHPHIRFIAHAVSAGSNGLSLSGKLQVGERSVELELPVALEHAPEGRIRLLTSTSVPRAHVGLAWNKAGMIRGDVLLDGDVELMRAP